MGDEDPKSAPDHVGYGHPPKHSQFKKGQSGNPGGRPKGAQSFTAAIRDAGDREVGKDKQGNPITARQFNADKIWHMAGMGDFRSLKLLVDLEYRMRLTDEAEEPEIIEVTLVLEEPSEKEGLDPNV
jgi:hypothetical protein